jgi:hypothetical protein
MFISKRNLLYSTNTLARLQGLVQDSLSVLSSHPTLGVPGKPFLDDPLAPHDSSRGISCGLLVYSNSSSYLLVGSPGLGSKMAGLCAMPTPLGITSVIYLCNFYVLELTRQGTYEGHISLFVTVLRHLSID